MAWLHDVVEKGISRIEREWNIQILTKLDIARYVDQYDWRWSEVYSEVLKLTDIWDQEEIEHKGKVWYLSQLLLTTSSLALTVKLCDMLANIEESNGYRISQEKRYLKAARVLLASERNDMNMHQVTLCNSIIDTVERHMSHRPLESVQHLT